MPKPDLVVVGGGLAGSEAAWQAAQSGLRVRLYEMQPNTSTGAHRTSDLAELVCSNSLGSNLPDRASGILKNELRRLSSLLVECAESYALPAGAALAVDRELFARVEIIAQRSRQALAFGPMRPTGLTNPRTGRWPYALVQLRQDNLARSLYNMVGFQTNITHPEQKRIFRMIPGLEKAEFIRYGQMHRNTFIASPKILLPTLQFRTRSDLFFAGQVTGVEGYMGNIATGLLAGLNAARFFHGQPPLTLPNTTLLGALCHYITQADLIDFQPMKANFGILPSLAINKRMAKSERSLLFAVCAKSCLESCLLEMGVY